MHQILRFSPIFPVAALLVIFVATASATELNGVVLDQSGQPVAGVTVKLLTSEMMPIQAVALNETTIETDESGRFEVTVPEKWFGYPSNYRQELTLLAGNRETGLGGIVVSRNLPLPNHSLTILLVDWSSRDVELVDAEGSPLKNVELKLSGLQLPLVTATQYTLVEGQRQIAPLPPEDSLSTMRTNENGVAELLLPPIESVGSLEADLGNGVRATWSIVSSNAETSTDWSRRLQLPRLTQVPLQIAAEPAAAINELSMIVSTMPRQGSEPRTTIQHSIVIDDTGAATITTLDNAILYFVPDAPDLPDWRIDQQFLENTSAVDAEGIQIRFREGISVTGKAVVTDGEPASDVNLFVMGGFSVDQLRTDDSGHFEFLAAPGQQLVVLVSAPGFRGPPVDHSSILMIPADAESFTVPDLVVARLKTVTGSVRDSDGVPVADASVLLLWDEPHPQARSARINRQETMQTDPAGRFSVTGVDPESSVRIAAWQRGAASTALREIPSADLANSIDVVVSPAATIIARGQVVDQAGHGVPGLPVQIRHRIDTPFTDAHLPVGEDVVELVTDNDGHFATTQTVRPWGEYIAVVRAGTQQEALSGWKTATTGSELQLPEILTSSITEYAGTVNSTIGDPIPEATVLLLTSTGQSQATTNEDGSFVVEAVGGRGPLLIASADGFSFNGVGLQSASENISIVLPRAGEPAPDFTTTAETGSFPPAMTIEERRDLAVKLFEMLPASDPQTRSRALSALARVDFEYALERLNELPVNNQAAMGIRRSLAMVIAPDHPVEALELIDELPDTGMKLYLLAMVEPRADLDDDERRELLARIVQDGRGVASADHRVMSMGLVGERLLDLGEREAGEALLREGHALAENMSPAAFSGYVRGAFAEELAQVDADAALALIEPLTDVDEFNRHLMNIAHELAPIDPERAAEILDLTRETPTAYIIDSRDGAVLRVCYRMVRVAPERAVELADSIEDDVMRVYCFGQMADSLLDQDEAGTETRTLAASLISDAWDILAAYPETNDQSEVAYLFPSTMAGLLLPATAELFPREFSSRVWQTIALRRPMVRSGSYLYAAGNCACELSLLLADVAPVRSRRVAAWIPNAEQGETAFRDFVQYSRAAAEMITTTSPDRIESSVAALSDVAIRNRLIHSFIAALSRTGESRQRAIRHDLSLWFPDDEDMGPPE